MNVGDLVRIKPHCANSGALAIVVGVPEWKGEVRITFLNPAERSSPTSKGLQWWAQISNLTLVSKS